jgi:hypothetical protein
VSETRDVPVRVFGKGAVHADEELHVRNRYPLSRRVRERDRAVGGVQARELVVNEFAGHQNVAEDVELERTADGETGVRAGQRYRARADHHRVLRRTSSLKD